MGKGSERRPAAVDAETFARRWARINWDDVRDALLQSGQAEQAGNPQKPAEIAQDERGGVS